MNNSLARIKLSISIPIPNAAKNATKTTPTILLVVNHVSCTPLSIVSASANTASNDAKTTPTIFPAVNFMRSYARTSYFNFKKT